MTKNLSQDFVERRLHPLAILPEPWAIDLGGKYYELDLKMCQLRSLDYEFRWGDDSGTLPRLSSVIDTPSRILKLDVSLNELSALDHEGLSPLKNLRELNASLNKIKKFIGIEVLKRLYSLNLSHNFIDRIEYLVPSASLVELNLSMNELTDISYMPSMINLQILNVNNNKAPNTFQDTLGKIEQFRLLSSMERIKEALQLKSLEGVQSLPKLRELYAQRNAISDLLPLTSCFHIQNLNLASNNIVTLHSAVGVLGQLKRLEVLTLMGNPVDRDRFYRTDILKQTNIMTLDNISVRPLPRQPSPKIELDMGNSRHIQNINSLKEAAKQAFQERMKESRLQMEENVNFLQRRIVSLQNEYLDYESKLKNDLESCLRYLDSLTASEMDGVNRSRIRDGIGTPHPKPWEGRRTHRREKERAEKVDYSHIKDTDELLRAAQKELYKEAS